MADGDTQKITRAIQMSRQQDPFTKIVLGVLSSLLVATVIGGIKMYADMQVMKRDLTAVADDKHQDERQDATLSKHWKYLAYLKTNLDEIRHAQGLPPTPPPDLGN